jgi:hypothetical protein
MANTYVKIASVTVGATPAATIDFSSIPATYDDLLLRVSLRTNNTDTPVMVYFNTDYTDANYSVRRLLGNGSAASSASFSAPYLVYANISTYTATTFGNADVYVPNYVGSTNKSVSADSVNENNATGAEAVLTAGLWSNTAVINAIRVDALTGSFVQYSTATLYGIKKS